MLIRLALFVVIALPACGRSGGGGDDDGAGDENTIALCQDDADNDGDGHVDCDDQDCTIFAICVGGDADSDTDTDADTDADSDVDSDADADSDADSDTGSDTGVDCSGGIGPTACPFYGVYCEAGYDYCQVDYTCYPSAACGRCCLNGGVPVDCVPSSFDDCYM
jgi:hypothetical protein